MGERHADNDPNPTLQQPFHLQVAFSSKRATPVHPKHLLNEVTAGYDQSRHPLPAKCHSVKMRLARSGSLSGVLLELAGRLVCSGESQLETKIDSV